jgi:glutathione synthase/RimK-type ligase-like ATP-grasp enzyme
MFKLAIHERKNSFSDRWISYCNENNIQYKKVNCLNSDIISQLKESHALLWHWAHFEPTAQLVAKQIIKAIETTGFSTFPDYNTCWHYDDKIAQKYLLESINAPIVPSYVFFDKEEALSFFCDAAYPLVFKLRCGAGSKNVQLLKSKNQAIRICQKAFTKGFVASKGYFNDAKTKIRKLNNFKELQAKIKRFPSAIKNILISKKFLPTQKGYIYLQDFCSDNEYDTRITVIGDRAFGFRRKVRPGDFRASGSGHIEYDPEKIDLRCVEIAFQVSRQLKTQSLAFDFIYNDKIPLICEISYCYQSKAVYDCAGHWNNQLKWIKGHMWPEDAIIIDLINDMQCHLND